MWSNTHHQQATILKMSGAVLPYTPLRHGQGQLHIYVLQENTPSYFPLPSNHIKERKAAK